MAFISRIFPPAAVQLYNLAWILLLPLAVWFSWVLISGSSGERMAVLLILISFVPFSMVQSGFSQRYLYIPYMGFAILVGSPWPRLQASKPFNIGGGAFLLLISWLPDLADAQTECVQGESIRPALETSWSIRRMEASKEDGRWT
jgi:hypothetical protein